jgi:hypothetical protein
MPPGSSPFPPATRWLSMGNATARAEFAVARFPSRGSVRVETVTSGPAPDLDGYTVALDDSPADRLRGRGRVHRRAERDASRAPEQPRRVLLSDGVQSGGGGGERRGGDPALYRLLPRPLRRENAPVRRAHGNGNPPVCHDSRGYGPSGPHAGCTRTSWLPTARVRRRSPRRRTRPRHSRSGPPDGRTLAFATAPKGSFEFDVALLPLDGGGAVTILDQPREQVPTSWR